PKTPLTAEPLCEGVVIFNITYGYYRFDQWNEVDSWDSSLFQYRFPSNERFIPDLPGGAGRLAGDVPPRQETGFNPLRTRVQMARVGEEMIAFTPVPDNLPGYIAIQLGLRDPVTMGRIRSFTFFVSLPMAQEQFDTTLADELNVTRRRP
ncbi:hypothetical protein IIC65_05370, partial [Candidatus Sumerlaeota bacterium]|nr:hypothetical protein [Candidatus Sumerlaeota bacterium]